MKTLTKYLHHAIDNGKEPEVSRGLSHWWEYGPKDWQTTWKWILYLFDVIIQYVRATDSLITACIVINSIRVCLPITYSDVTEVKLNNHSSFLTKSSHQLCESSCCQWPVEYCWSLAACLWLQCKQPRTEHRKLTETGIKLIPVVEYDCVIGDPPKSKDSQERSTQAPVYY